jgi:predicted RNA-binding Zn ribbon-like protein
VSTAGPAFVFLGEHPALDFANTLYAPHGELEDQLRSWADLVKWLQQANLSDGTALEATRAEADMALEAVVMLRTMWTKQIAGMLEGKPVGREFLRILNASLEKDLFSEAVVADGEGAFLLQRSESTLRGGEWVLAILSRQIAGFLTGCNHDYLRQCAGAGCVLYFYDTTKNHRRQWCSAAACGNRHKVAAFRERQAKRQGG